MIERRYGLDDLLNLMRRLRDPEFGCPWDLKQDYRSIAPSTIEEAYELVDAIESGDLIQLREELGDFLFQVVFYSQLGAEEGAYSFYDVVDGLTRKLIRRHPHVFPDGTLESRRSKVDDLAQVQEQEKINASWEAIKQQERAEKGKSGLFDDIPLSLPALSRANKIQKRLAKSQSRAQTIASIVARCEQNLASIRESGVATRDDGEMEKNIGSLLYECANIARQYGLDPEQCLRKTNKQHIQQNDSSLGDSRPWPSKTQ